MDEEEGFWLISPKAKHSLNSQFDRSKYIHIPPSVGYEDGIMIKLTSKYGEFVAPAKVDDRLRDDCVLVYSGTSGVNKLTPSIVSDEGDGACYGEVKVELKNV